MSRDGKRGCAKRHEDEVEYHSVARFWGDYWSSQVYGCELQWTSSTSQHQPVALMSWWIVMSRIMHRRRDGNGGTLQGMWFQV